MRGWVGVWGLLAAATAFIVSGCGSAPSASCRAAGAACTIAADCCDLNDLCTGGRCTAATPGCVNVGQMCSASSRCCDINLSCVGNACVAPTACGLAGKACASLVPCCSGLTCSGGKCGAAPTCATSGQFCTSLGDCCQNLTCPRFGTRCALGLIGDPCSANGDCGAGLTCNGWCTKACASKADCASGNEVNECVSTTSGFLCFPFCTTSGQCAIYGAGVTCGPSVIAEGGSINTCGA